MIIENPQKICLKIRQICQYLVFGWRVGGDEDVGSRYTASVLIISVGIQGRIQRGRGSKGRDAPPQKNSRFWFSSKLKKIQKTDIFLVFFSSNFQKSLRSVLCQFHTIVREAANKKNPPLVARPLDNSKIIAHVWSDLAYLIYLRHLFRTRSATNFFF